jgi:hypothetical protein
MVERGLSDNKGCTIQLLKIVRLLAAKRAASKLMIEWITNFGYVLRC